MNTPLADVLAGWSLPELVGGLWRDAPPLHVSDIVSDSREVRPGALFLALRGERHDGREYLAAAAQAGAVAALVDDALPADVPPMPVTAVRGLRGEVGPLASRFFGQPSRALHIAAVTGTNGKTTVSQLTAQLIRAGGYSCATLGTLGASVDGRPAASLHTTPDPIALHRTLADWVGDAIPFVTMEASSHALDQDRLAGVDIDSAIFTNLTRDHLDYHGDMAAYGAAKARLFRQPGLRTALVNADDDFAADLIAALPATVNCLRYSASGSDAELRLSGLELDGRGMRARLHSPWGSATLRCPLLGRFNAANVLAALGAAVVAGLTLEQAVAATARLEPVAGRMEAVRGDRGPLVVIDYAHTPDALAQVLAALRPQTRGRLTLVFGCGGDRDRGKRAEMARAASAGADFSYLTSDNPRGEDPAAIIADIEVAMEGEYRTLVDRAAAIGAAIGDATDADCVLIAGKGHEDYQVIGDQRLPFSDLEQARLALQERGA